MYKFLIAIICSVLTVPSFAGEREDICSRYEWACSNQSGSIGSFTMNSVQQVNNYVNRRVIAVTDEQLYGRYENWSLPLMRGNNLYGDCEDYALLKKKLLLQQGLPGNSLLLATVVHIVDSEMKAHAVLLFKDKNEWYVLDNLTDKILRKEDTEYYFAHVQNHDDPTQWVILNYRGKRYNR